MESNFWWVWMILAAFFVVGEIFTAGFFLLWFGVGAVAAGLIALLGFVLEWQLVVFILSSLVLFAVSRRIGNRFSRQQPLGVGADRFVGAEGVVLQKIENNENVGRVRLEREDWRAESETGEQIGRGERVVVTRISGTHLVVKPLREGE